MIICEVVPQAKKMLPFQMHPIPIAPIEKYVISSCGVSQWGIKVNYLLIGKEKTNYNAVKRAIVLHFWENITSEEVYPKGTPEGWGCSAISNENMKEIDSLLKANKNMLLWIIK